MLGIKMDPNAPAQEPIKPDHDLGKRRLAICQQCTYFRDNKCTLCGCGGTIERLKWPKATCPKNYFH